MICLGASKSLGHRVLVIGSGLQLVIILQRNSYLRVWVPGQKFYKRAGLDGFRFQDLRDTLASHLAMNGLGLKAVQELLEHADLTLARRYAHFSQGHLQAAVSVLNGLGRKTDTKLTPKAPKTKGADILSVANPL